MTTSSFHDSTFTDLDNVIRSVARKVAREWKLNWDQHGDDLVQCGWVGVMRASERYKPQGYKFATYAWYFVNGDIRRAAAHITGKFITTDIDGEEDLLPVGGSAEHDMFVRQLLASPDGLELLAEELNLRDDSKRGAAIRKAQRIKLKDKLADSA